MKPPCVGMKPLSERDENGGVLLPPRKQFLRRVGMKPLSERDENKKGRVTCPFYKIFVGMKPLSERDENCTAESTRVETTYTGRNEATL